MKSILMSLFLLISMVASAQGQPTYEIVPAQNQGEMIWKGSCTFAQLATVPAFHLEEQQAAYTPKAADIGALTGKLADYQLLVFLGTWCEDSHRMIPQLYRVLNDAAYPTASLQLFTLDRDKKGLHAEEQQYGITNVPTIIVLKDGKEKGRITEIVNKSVEADLAAIIAK